MAYGTKPRFRLPPSNGWMGGIRAGGMGMGGMRTTNDKPEGWGMQQPAPGSYGTGWNYQAPQTPVGWYPSENDWRLRLYQNLQGFQGSGYFDPKGNQMLQDIARMNAANTSAAMQHRLNTASRVYGLDPGQAGAYRMQGMLGAMGGQARAEQDALMEAIRSQNAFAQQMALQQFGMGQYQRGQPSANPWGAILGGVGSAIGGYFGGPPGALAGDGLGRAAGGAVEWWG